MLSLPKHLAVRRIFYFHFRYARFFDYAQNDKENLKFHRLKHQADNLAKLRQEFLSVIELIAKIFGAVSRTISLMRLSALLASKRCRCRNDGFCFFYCLRIFCKSHLYIRAKVCYNKLSYKLISGEQYELERLHP